MNFPPPKVKLHKINKADPFTNEQNVLKKTKTRALFKKAFKKSQGNRYLNSLRMPWEYKISFCNNDKEFYIMLVALQLYLMHSQFPTCKLTGNIYRKATWKSRNF